MESITVIQNFFIILFYFADGSTLLLRSSGHLGDHQPQLAGVYRMVDNYNDRPVYKQDMGENYIYYRYVMVMVIVIISHVIVLFQFWILQLVGGLQGWSQIQLVT